MSHRWDGPPSKGPGRAAAVLSVVSEDGAFVPLGQEQVSVDPDSVAQVDLTRALEGRAAAVHLRAEVPVTGAVRSAAGGDTGYAFSAVPLSSPAGVVLAGSRTEVQLVTDDKPASLEVVAYDSDGRAGSSAVTVPASGIRQVALPSGAAYAVVLPRSGAVSVAVTSSGPGLAVQPAEPLPTTLERPAVLPWTGATGP